MECKKCKINKICIINESVKKYRDIADMTITNCQHYTENTVEKKASVRTDEDMSLRRNVDLNRLNQLSKQNDNTKKKNLKAIEQQNRKNKPKQIKAKPLKLDAKCNTCNAHTYESDKGKCDKCGIEICSACATYDTEGQQVLCDKCWKEL